VIFYLYGAGKVELIVDLDWYCLPLPFLLFTGLDSWFATEVYVYVGPEKPFPHHTQ